MPSAAVSSSAVLSLARDNRSATLDVIEIAPYHGQNI
jgi:hypothetical protein